MRRRILSRKPRVAAARALAIAGAVTVLACGSLLTLVGGATPAVAGCGDGVTYQAGTAAGGCPHAAVGAAVACVLGFALGAAAVLAARAILASASSVGDMAAVDGALITVEMVDELAETGPTAYTGVPDLAELAEQKEIADELEEAGQGNNESVASSFDSADGTETITKGGIEAGKPAENEPKPTEPVSTGQVAITSVNPYPLMYTQAEPDLINPIRDITVIVAAIRVGVQWAREGRFK